MTYPSEASSFPTHAELKELFKRQDPSFQEAMHSATLHVQQFADLLSLHNLRKKALQNNEWTPSSRTLRLAIVGGSNLRPLADLVEHFVTILLDSSVKLWVGDYDNYISEIMEDTSELYAFGPELVFVLPSEARCRFTGNPTSSLAEQKTEAELIVSDLLRLAEKVFEATGAQVVLGNFRLTSYFDPGPLRTASLASDYSFRKYVNLQLGLRLPAYAHLCDIEFLANRLGTTRALDERTWFESKQPFSVDLMVDVAREFATVASQIKSASKKVIVLDLDNTLWGGVIGDDGLDGIEIGTTSPRGEAYRHFQQTLLELSKRGVLLAVCSKNDHENAVEPFLKHPEMVLRLTDIVSFKANWEPKSDNLREIARDLNLTLDSLVFVDDNPAEIEIVRQFVPEVTTLWLGDDPSTYADMLRNSRLFELRSLTQEDLIRTRLYREDVKRQELQNGATDMASYLASLQMSAAISEFASVDVPRITQLINKSNQFNLTTRRRTEAEVRSLCSSSTHASFTVRLADRHGDHGLIAIVITKLSAMDLIIDTWLMSCRVLKRGVEDVTLEEIVRLAREHQCRRVVGSYKPTSKNSMVKDLYPKMGFTLLQASEEESVYTLDVAKYSPSATSILVAERAYVTS